jgi:hypothetical protein
MDMTELTVKLLLLFFPGIICHQLVDALVVHRERKLHEVFLLSFVYGILSYLIFAAILCAASQSWSPQMAMFAALTDSEKSIDVWEVMSVSGLACVLAIVMSAALNRYWFHDIARSFGVSRKFGQPNVWSFALNANEVRWATVRDIENKLMFQGYVRAFSDNEDPAEILLTEVCVYNEHSAELLYEADHIYLARPRGNLTIEFPIVPQPNSNWRKRFYSWLTSATGKLFRSLRDRLARVVRIRRTKVQPVPPPHKAAADNKSQTKVGTNRRKNNK